MQPCTWRTCGSTPMTKPAGSPSELLLLQAAKLDALFYRTSGEPTAGELMLSVSCMEFASKTCTSHMHAYVPTRSRV